MNFTHRCQCSCADMRTKVYDCALSSLECENIRAVARENLPPALSVCGAWFRERSAAIEHISISEVPCRRFLRRLRAVVCAPVCIELAMGGGRQTIVAIAEIPVDVLIHIPDTAPCDITARLDGACVRSAVFQGQGVFTLCADVSIEVCVIVSAPCEPKKREICGCGSCELCRGQCAPQCPPPRPQLCLPSCGQPSQTHCNQTQCCPTFDKRPRCPEPCPPPRPCPPVCLPQCPPPCPPRDQCCCIKPPDPCDPCQPPMICLPLYPR